MGLGVRREVHGRDDRSLFTMLPPFPVPPIYSNPKKLLARIEDEFSINIETHSYKRSAFDHDVLIINHEMVFRFPRSAECQSHLKEEIALLRFIRNKTTAHVPDYSHVSARGDFAGYRLINGKTLTPSAFRRLSKSDKEAAISQIAEFLSYLHKIELADFNQFSPRHQSDFREVEERIKKELRSKLLPRLSKMEIQSIEEFYESSRSLLGKEYERRAVHGDFYSENMIWDKHTSQLGIIDFTDCLVGDPAKDFEALFEFGDDFVQLAYERYQGTKDDFFLDRAERYYKVHSIYTLLSFFFDSQISYDWAYSSFRERFGLNSAD